MKIKSVKIEVDVNAEMQAVDMSIRVHYRNGCQAAEIVQHVDRYHVGDFVSLFDVIMDNAKQGIARAIKEANTP